MIQNSVRNRLVVHLEGGAIQSILSDSIYPAWICIMDTDDTDSGDEVMVCDDGTKFYGYLEEPEYQPDKVNQAFAAYGERTGPERLRRLRFVNNSGDSCPVCKSDNLRMDNPVGIENCTCSCDVECLDCQSSWNNIYTLSGYDSLSSDYIAIDDHGFSVNINLTQEQAEKFQSILIHGVKERLSHDALGICDVDDGNPEFFSIYLQDHEGLSQCFGDCGKAKLPVLRQLATSLAETHGWAFIDHTLTINSPY